MLISSIYYRCARYLGGDIYHESLSMPEQASRARQGPKLVQWLSAAAALTSVLPTEAPNISGPPAPNLLKPAINNNFHLPCCFVCTSSLVRDCSQLSSLVLQIRISNPRCRKTADGPGRPPTAPLRTGETRLSLSSLTRGVSTMSRAGRMRQNMPLLLRRERRESRRKRRYKMWMLTQPGRSRRGGALSWSTTFGKIQYGR